MRSIKKLALKAAVLGAASVAMFAASAGVAYADDDQVAAGGAGIANNINVDIEPKIPVNVCQVSVGVLVAIPVAAGSCKNTIVETHAGGDNQVAADNNGILNGVNLDVDPTIPINVCQVAVGVGIAVPVAAGKCENTVVELSADKNSGAETMAAPVPATSQLPATDVAGLTQGAPELPLIGQLGLL